MLKHSARINGLRPEMLIAILAAERIWLDYGQDLVITSATDGVHSSGSRHHVGLAVDLRTRYFSPGQRVDVAEKLVAALAPHFDVVMEPDHIHVEFDPTP